MEPEYVLFNFDGWIQFLVIRNKWYVDPQHEQEFISSVVRRPLLELQ
jgi:hypothetical protein